VAQCGTFDADRNEHVTRNCKGGYVAKPIFQVPELMVGFDTETTGLSVTTERAISYGFCVYRYGRLVRSEHFFVIPDQPISEGARRVHGLSLEDLEAKRSTDTVMSVEAGLTKATQLLADFHNQGAYILGANVVRFDLEMLRRSCRSLLGRELDDAEFDISLLRIIDVIDHDLAIEPSRDLRPRRGLEQLCQHYGVKPGGHSALEDARATVEVFMEQVVRNNQGQMTLELLPVEMGVEEAIETH
jgi:DNA polymerase-3 subunit epsilon